MDPTQNPAFVIFAALSPLLIAFVKQSGWSRQANALVAFAGYIVVGIVGAVMSGIPLTIENAVQLVTTATVIGSVAYKLLWDNIGVTTTAGVESTEPLSLDEKITEATSIVK